MFSGAPALFAPGIASTEFSDVRLTLSPDGRTAIWFSRNRLRGAGGYDIWMSRRVRLKWMQAEPVSFNSPGRDFDPAFSADGAYVYFCSDRPGGAGGDDLYRVRVLGEDFGTPEHLGNAVNSARQRMGADALPGRALSAVLERCALRRGKDGSLHIASVASSFETPRPLPGDVNTAEDEFDATFLADGESIVFSRARDLRADRVRLFHARPVAGRYDHGSPLPALINTPGGDTYAPMLDWSRHNSLTFTTRRPASAASVDVYVVRYRR